MSFRVFKRKAWKRNANWPGGWEPHAVPMDRCRTVARFNTRSEAVAYCTERNDQRRHHYRDPFYEFTEV